MTSDIQTIARGDASRISQPRRDRRPRRGASGGRCGPRTPAPSTEAPPVDFSTRMVAAVFQGQRPSAGFETTIVDARADGDVLDRQVDEHPPAAGALAAQRARVALPHRLDAAVRRRGPVRGYLAARQRGHTGGAFTPSRPDCRGARPDVAIVDRARARSRGRTGLPGGPFSGGLLLIVERTSRYVRFHAWQAFSASARSASPRSAASGSPSRCLKSCPRAASRSCDGWPAWAQWRGSGSGRSGSPRRSGVDGGRCPRGGLRESARGKIGCAGISYSRGALPPRPICRSLRSRAAQTRHPGFSTFFFASF